MRRSVALKSSLAPLCALALISVRTLAQNPPNSESPQEGVVMTKLLPPVYPPLAKQAHIVGDVALMLKVRQDGGVESIEVVSGPALLALRQAAIDSARQSQFECRKCDEATTSFRLVYTFLLKPDDCCAPSGNPPGNNGQKSPPRITQTQRHVILTEGCEDACTCDPVVERRKARSAKCLWLWKCHHHDRLLDGDSCK